MRITGAGAIFGEPFASRRVFQGAPVENALPPKTVYHAEPCGCFVKDS